MDFIKRFLSLGDYFEVAGVIRKFLGNGAALPKQSIRPTSHAPSQLDVDKEIAKRNWIFDKLAKPVVEGDPVWKYLNNRVPGLKIPESVRYLPNADYWENSDAGPKLIGRFPAMIVRGFDPHDRCVQLHTTYLTYDGAKANVEYPKKTRTSLGVSSYCFRLSQIDETGVLGISEGIETAFAAELRFGHPVWSCHSNTVLANFEIPSSVLSKVSKLIIYSDNDGWRTRQDGTKWNPGLSKARELKQKLGVVRRPDGKVIPILIAYTATIGDFAD
jgi:hypothetical protein